jgi:hypothetical protein
MSNVQAVVDRVAALGPEIGAAASAGDKSARAVIDAYVLVFRCPRDLCAATLLEIALDAWLADRPAEAIA